MSVNEPSDPKREGEAPFETIDTDELKAVLVDGGIEPPPGMMPPSEQGDLVEEIEVEPEVVEAPAPPRLPGLPRPPAPPPPGPRAKPAGAAPPPPVEAVPPPVASLDDTIAAAKARAAAMTSLGRTQLFEAEITALGPQSRKRQGLYAHEVGQLAADRGDEAGAVKAWARALQADPALRPNLWAVRRVFERRGMWPNVLRLIDAELRSVQQGAEPQVPDGSGAERAELLVDRGTVLEDRLDDAAGAQVAFEQALEADPMCLRAYMALERRLLQTRADPAQHRRVVAGMAKATADRARRAALLIDLARLEAEGGEEGADRAKAALDEALAIERETNRDAPAAIDELERLSMRFSRPAWRAEALEQRIALLGLDAVPRPPSSEQDSNRIARGVLLRLRLATLAEERGDTAAQVRALEAASELAVHDPAAQALVGVELADALRQRGDAGRAGALVLAFARQTPPPLLGALLVEAVALLGSAARGGDQAAAEAEQEARRELEAAGLHAVLDARTRREAELRSDDEALVAAARAEGERLLAAGDVGAGAGFLARAATLTSERLGRTDEAVALHEQALSALPPGAAWDEQADALEWRLVRSGSMDAVVALLTRRLDAERAGPKRAQLLRRKAGVLADRLDDAAGAADALRELLELAPNDLRLRHTRVALLRRASDPVGAAAELAQIVKRTAAPADKAALEVERGALLGWHADDIRAGEAALHEALRHAPSDGRATVALEELFERRKAAPSSAADEPESAERIEALATALRGQVDGELDPARVVPMLSRLAELHERDRDDPKTAAVVYLELLDRSTDGDEQAAALRGLQRCHARLGDVSSLLTSLERESELVAPAARSQHRARIAWEKERTGRAQDAEIDHEALLEVPGSNEVSAAAHLGALRAAYRIADPAALATALGGVLSLVDPELAGTRAAIDVELAESLRAAGELDDAAVTAARAHAAAPEQRATVIELLVTAGAREDVRGVGSAMVELAGIAPAPLRGELLRRAAWNAWSQADAETARVRAESAIASHVDPSTTVALAEISSGINGLEARLALAEGAGRLPWLLALAEAQATLGMLAESSKTLAELLEACPRSVLGLELDRRVRKAANDRRGHARRTLALGELLAETEQASLLLAEAGTAFEALGDLHSAAYAYREALERSPLDGATFAKARGLLLGTIEAGDDAQVPFARGALLELYDHQLAHIDEASTRCVVLLDRAELAASAGDRAAAESDLRAALDIDERNARGLAALVKLVAEDALRIAEVRELAQRYAALEGDPTQRRDVLLRVADAEQASGGDPQRAILALEQAIAIDEDAPTLMALAKLLRAERHWQRAIDVRRRLVAQLPAAQAVPLELETAELYATGFADKAAAREAAQRALALDPLSAEAILVVAQHITPQSPRAMPLFELVADEARALLVDSTRRARGIEHLGRVAQLIGDEELVALADQAAALFQGRTPTPRATALPLRSVADVSKELVVSPQTDVLGELLAALGETTTRLHPIDARFGKTARVSSKQKAEVVPLETLARLVGVDPLPLELGEGASIAADHVRVVAGRELLRVADQSIGRFRAARTLWLYAHGLGVLDRLDDAAIIGLVAGCLGVAKAPWPATLDAVRPSAAVAAERTHAVDKVLSRKERKALLVLAPRLGAMSDPRRFRLRTLDSANRIAALVGADLAAAATELGVEGASTLATFVVSSAFGLARKRLMEKRT